MIFENKSTFNTIEKVIVKNNILNYQIIFIDDCQKIIFQRT